MDLRQLRAFVAIYEEGALSRAAERERSAASVISHHLSNLEAQLPKPLFVRSARGLVPTEHGHRLYAHATQILRAVEFAQEDLANLGGEIGGKVAVGMAYTALQAIGRQLMRIVLEDYPKLSLMLSETLSGSTIRQMLDAQIDLALAYNPSQDARLRSTPLLEERMVCIGKKQVIGDTSEAITVQQLLGLPFVLLRKGIMGRSIMDDVRLQKQFEQHARLHTDNVNAVTQFVLEGHGCVIGTQSYLRHEIERGEVAYRYIVEPTMLRTLHLCEHVDRPPSSSVSLMRDIMLQLIADEVRAGRWEAARVLFDVERQYHRIK